MGRTFGVIAPPVTGHFNPLAALGHELQERGHRVIFLSVPDWQQKVQAEGFDFYPVGVAEYPPSTLAVTMEKMSSLNGLSNLSYSIAYYKQEAEIFLRDVPSAIDAEGIDALIVDQTERAGGTVAEYKGKPFVTVCCALALNQEPNIPPFITPWNYQSSWWARQRNRLGYFTYNRITHPIREAVQLQRQRWGLPRQKRIDDASSRLAQICQQPPGFDFPRSALPDCFHYTGPLRGRSLVPTEFPFDRLDERPLVYASLGTIQNRRVEVFQTIAAACADLPVQLVIAHGGTLSADVVNQLPGDPLVVSYAPQIEVIRRANLVITHGGLNTTLDALAYGVPLVVIPFVHEQPAIACRVQWTGTGEIVWSNQLTTERLRATIERVLGNPAYQTAALRLKASCEQAGGVTKAADIIERVITTGQPVLANR
ncbi:glycosyltransferase [Mastigocladopsis repens]|uniref:glycosyltransferase n=1 Tax=Mastigocladopsis repens TaxID=221287 RepID=UPI000317F138|nr:glycosyltransferase [Mastigocladopsis repens]